MAVTIHVAPPGDVRHLSVHASPITLSCIKGAADLSLMNMLVAQQPAHPQLPKAYEEAETPLPSGQCRVPQNSAWARLSITLRNLVLVAIVSGSVPLAPATSRPCSAHLANRLA